uniref:Uncharacterized protein n=1 Tax=Physcomitrium patens TaxID=3218 RepID=A0A2K1KNK2_PHYPA|nr:hypothetical protein PHYPA_006238 [Physcomitrium patens]
MIFQGILKTLFHNLSLDFVDSHVVNSCKTKYMLVIIEHFNKRIEFVALSQFFSKLETMVFF